MTDQKQAPERIWFFNDDVAGWIGLSKPHLDQYGMEPVPYVRKDLHDAAIKRQASAAKTLRNATLAEVQHLKDKDRSEYNAAKSLDSEREANARLTAEVETLTKQRDELAAIHDELAGMRDEDGFLGSVAQWIKDMQTERDQALARAAAAAMEMRERSAEHAWNKRDLLADAEKKQIDAGLTGRDYYGRRLEAELLSRSIRALRIDPDATAALNEMLADAWDDGYQAGLYADKVYRPNPYRKGEKDDKS